MELDEAIAKHVYPKLEQRHASWYIEDIHVRIEDYTTSLDAALTLVDSLPRKPHWSVAYPVADVELIFSGGPVINALAATPALALCIAALKARQT